MGSFKQEKGGVLASIESTTNMRVTVHKNTDPALVKMLTEAIDKAKNETPRG